LRQMDILDLRKRTINELSGGSANVCILPGRWL